MKSTSLLLCFLACCGSLAAQEANEPKKKKGEAQSKPAAKAKPAKPEPAKSAKRAGPAIQWGNVQRLFRPQQNPVVIRRMVAGPGQVVLLGGNNRVILDGLNPNAGSLTFEKFVSSEIGRVAKICKLSPEQKRKIEVAAKGVVHREKAKSAAAKAKQEPAAPNPGIRVIRFVIPQQANDFEKQLNASKLWKRTLGKVLTKEQQTAWRNRPARKPVKAAPTFRLQRDNGRMFRLNQAIEALNINLGR